MNHSLARIGQVLFVGLGAAVIGSLLGHADIGALIGLLVAATWLSAPASAAAGGIIGAVTGIVVAFGQTNNTILLQASLPALTGIPTSMLSLLLAVPSGAFLGGCLAAALSWFHRQVSAGPGVFWS